MTPEEIIKAVENLDFTEELIEEIIRFEWNYDSYEVMDQYGHIDDDGVREQMADDIRYVLDTEPKAVIDYIKGVFE